MSIALTSSAVAPNPLARALHWYRDAFRLWRRAPLMLVALCLASLLVEGLLQLIPWAGVAISKMVVPMIGAGVWVGLDRLHRGERLRFAFLWAAWRQTRWAALWLLSASVGLLVFGVQLTCAWAVYGSGAVDVVLFGHVLAHPALLTRAFQYVLMLPGLLPSALLVFAMPLFLFRRTTVAQALAGSLRLVVGVPVAMVLAMLPQLVLFALALGSPWGMPLLLVLMPIGSLVSYVAWRDVSASPATAEHAGR